MEEPLQRNKRPALFVAKPPIDKKHQLSVEISSHCAVCHLSPTSKQNPLHLPSHDTWKSLGVAADKWRKLKGRYSELYKQINLNEQPCLIHKVCKLNITGSMLKRAKAAFHKVDIAPVETSHTNSPVKQRSSSRCHYSPASSCVLCTKPLHGKYVRCKNSKSKICVQSHHIETAEAWSTFVRSVDFVKDPQKKSRLLALVSYCNGEGGI